MTIRYRLGDLVAAICCLTIYRLARIVPKRKNLWVFGAWKGETYSDNSKYLFEYVNKHHKEITAVWITNNRLAASLVKQGGYHAKYFGRVGSIWACMRADVAIACVDGVRDLPGYALNGTTKRIQLWHGLGPKAYHMSRMSQREASEIAKLDTLSKIINKIVLIYSYLLTGKWYNGIKWLPYSLMPKQDLVITTSELGRDKMQQVFGEMASKIEMLGYPRHDNLVNLPKNNPGDEVNVFYAPTHRSESQGEVIVDIRGLYQALKSHPKIKFVTKLHDLAVVNSQKLDMLKQLPNFELLTETQISQDVYTVLPKMDLLITDYSSIYTDYLLLKRPIIFVPFDKKEYANNDQGFFMDYDQITPGPKAKGWQEVMELIATYEKWEMNYSRDQARVLDLFHKVRDGHSCQRIVERLLKLGNEIPDSVPN